MTYMYVVPSLRRRGLGTQIINFCKERAREQKLPLVGSPEPQAYQFFVAQKFDHKRHWDFHLDEWAPPRNGFGLFRLQGMQWDP